MDIISGWLNVFLILVMLIVVNKQHGFSTSIILLLVLVLSVIGFAGYKVLSQKKLPKQEHSTQTSSSGQGSKDEIASCNDKPLLDLPIEVQRIKSVLYPGQVRGNNFKPHGGFILNGTNDANVTLPLEAKVIDGVRYIESGELQYMFDFENGCGYRMRLDHLHTLSPAMQKIADQLPQPTADSRTTQLGSETFEKGTVIATKVGFVKNNNTGFDLGFYNMNTPNTASQTTDWPTDFQYQTELAKHAVCWFDYLSKDDAALIRSLPAGDSAQGKNSVYCK
jgi:hypothetical protein